MKLTVFRRVYSSFLVSIVRRSISTVDKKMDVFVEKRNPITGSTEWDMQHENYDYHQEIARSAYGDMLHDTERNEMYHMALKMAIEKMHAEGKPANVLDIGTGTGLLSILAARCGADSIVACEAFKPMAECCIKILEQNGVADKITVIPKRSTELTVGEDGDMKKKANILVTEVFDTELIGEGALSTFSHAHKYLLEKECIVVPDSAVMYAQVVESKFLQKWNKLNDLVYEEKEVTILKTPKKIKKCAGSAAVHDIQLSQLPRHLFLELSEKLPVFKFDWSGKTPIEMKRIDKHTFHVICPGKAQIVFMWWELNMDPEGKILLSCAPWWCHPLANTSRPRSQDSIPWRDHWLQAVYYLPKPITLHQFTDVTLVACHDEYSLWFYLEDETHKYENYHRPICECGVHMTFSRTHVGYMNDERRNQHFLKTLTSELKEVNNAIVLDLNGSSLLGLAAARMGAKTVYILETMNLNIQILNDYIIENQITNVKILPYVEDDILKQVTLVICDPNFSSAILPWENLRMAHILHGFRNRLKDGVSIVPERCQFWAMPVEFKNLHKLRMPLGKCEGINMRAFDKLVENSRIISDAEIEPYPLWEYPCTCRGQPRKILEIDMAQLKVTYASNNTLQIADKEVEEQPINGFVIGASWLVGDKSLGAFPLFWPTVGDPAVFDAYSSQAVKILDKTYTMQWSDNWSYQVACDLEKGDFNVKLDLVSANVNKN